ncbi:flagellar hook-basal body complex protein [Alicyclobacillus acidiphilus]|uniref:flagellar hook-basal body complex protein n=2 Tax=Alicyclobacillus acidiphilus TaxID=182455 RepID=UPI002892AD79|nr:flagellar hook-basal body complex protein [Alicyclobacillus acidiphilus]
MSMLRSMNSAISGMQAFQTDLDVVGNNIANVNTIGFKSQSVNFSDIMSQTLAGGNAGSTTVGGTNPEQVGLGVQVADTEMDTSQGPDETTGNATDVAIQGTGYFVIQNAAGTEKYLTRAGDFSVDSAGNLVLPDGNLAMGYYATTSGTSSGNLEPINLQSFVNAATTGSYSTPATPYNIGNVTIGDDGSINVTYGNGSTSTTKTVGYLALASVPNPAGLNKVGDNLFSYQSVAAGTPTVSTPGTGVMGTLASGELEQSNVDLSQQFAEMIVAQNAYVANTHMIGTDNTILQALVNMKNS